MVFIFTDGSRSNLQGLYFLLGIQNSDNPLRTIDTGKARLVLDNPEIEGIVVEQGPCDLETSVTNVRNLLANMERDIPVYIGSEVPPTTRIPDEWADECMAIDLNDPSAVLPPVTGDEEAIINEPVDIISLSQLSTAAKWIDEGKVGSITLFAGGPAENVVLPAPPVEMNVYLDPQAYNDVISSSVPKLVYTTNNIDSYKISAARMMGLSSQFMRSLVPTDRYGDRLKSISSWKFWHLVYMLDLRGHFKDD